MGVTIPTAVVAHRDSDENHRSHRSGWLRAAVLGANVGLLSTAALLTGVAAGNASRSTIVLTGVAAMAAGAFSMAAGEYGSVSTQRDAELADIAKERRSLENHPEAEQAELVAIYRKRGFPDLLAAEIAEHLHSGDPLAAHLRDELGLDENELARPLQAALTSAVSFLLGALVPVLCMMLSSDRSGPLVTTIVSLAMLAALGAIAAHLGGAPKLPATARLVVLGAVSMAATALIGRAVGSAV